MSLCFVQNLRPLRPCQTTHPKVFVVEERGATPSTQGGSSPFSAVKLQCLPIHSVDLTLWYGERTTSDAIASDDVGLVSRPAYMVHLRAFVSRRAWLVFFLASALVSK